MDLLNVPLYDRLSILLLALSGLACLLVAAAGLMRRVTQAELPIGLPPLPPSARERDFPGVWDQAYTFVFIFFYLWSVTDSLGSPKAPETSDAGGESPWALMRGNLVLLAIYMPMLVRYALLPRWERPALSLRRCLAWPLLALLGIYVAVGATELLGLSGVITNLTGCPEKQEVMNVFIEGSRAEQISIAVSAVVIAPVCEECCFRGFLYATLKRWGGPVAAALASGMLFGAIHASLPQFIPLAIFGVAQCIAYEKAGSLWLPIAVHALFNTVSLCTSV